MTATVLALLALSSPDIDAFEKRAKELFEATTAPGMVCAVILPNGRSVAFAQGFADLESKTPMRTHHRMPAGSTGKTFFAAVILQLVSEGKLDLDKPISAYVGKEKWFSKLPNADALTLRVLMNHTSGIPEYVELPEVVDLLKANPDRVFGHEELVSTFIAGKKPLHDVGKGWSYADANYILAGVVAERALKIDLYREIRKRILDPLELKETAPSDQRILANLATGYSMPNSPFLPEGPVLEKGKFKLNPQFEWAGGGFASTPKDLARWCKAVFSGDVLSDAIRKQMLDGVKARTGPNDKYGLGAMIEPMSAGQSYGHEGWFPGYLTQMAYFPEHKLAIAVQFNTDDFAKLKHRTRYFIDELAKAALVPESR